MYDYLYLHTLSVHSSSSPPAVSSIGVGWKIQKRNWVIDQGKIVKVNGLVGTDPKSSFKQILGSLEFGP